MDYLYVAKTVSVKPIWSIKPNVFLLSHPLWKLKSLKLVLVMWRAHWRLIKPCVLLWWIPHATVKHQWHRKPRSLMEMALHLVEGYSGQNSNSWGQWELQCSLLTFPLQAAVLIFKTFYSHLSFPMEVISLLEPNI